jgi:L-seryl-tRNA(Ser) seleniumtransferase
MIFGRRPFLGALGSLPIFSRAGLAAPRRRDVISELGVRTFINAAGTYTMLTASLMPEEVFEAMRAASRHYVNLTELQDAVGRRIAELLGCEAAMVTSGAAGALTVGTAACITGKDPDKIRRIPDLTGMKSEVIIQKSHRFAYDHAVRATGIRMVEVESAEQFERAVSDKTAMALFFNDAEPRGPIKAEEFVALCRKHGIPSFNDCAADVPPVENLSRYTKMGFDLVAFSGGKGIRGPQSAGLLLGRKDLIEAARLNTSPYSDSIARGMKVNKEEMVGMLVALELYLKRDHAAEAREWDRRVEIIAREAKKVNTVTTEVHLPPIANHTPHLRIRWDQSVVKITPPEVMKQLRDGRPSIEACPMTNKDALVFTVWMMQKGDAEIVGRRVREILARASA